MYSRVNSKIDEAQDSLSIALREFNITESSDNAIKSAQKALSGNDMEMFTRSMAAISDQTFQMVGEVEYFMDTTRPLLEMDKVTDAVQSEKALASLQEWMKHDTPIMNKQEKKQLALTAGNPDLFVSVANTKSRPTVKVVANGKTDDEDDVVEKYGLDDK